MKNNATHILLTVFLLVLLILLTDPFMLWMPPLAVMLALFAVAAVIALWAGFVMKEKAMDEREALHRMKAGRIAYLAGLLILTVAFIVEGLAHRNDPWITLALGVMVVAKLVSRLYYEKYR